MLLPRYSEKPFYSFTPKRPSPRCLKSSRCRCLRRSLLAPGCLGFHFRICSRTLSRWMKKVASQSSLAPWLSSFRHLSLTLCSAMSLGTVRASILGKISCLLPVTRAAMIFIPATHNVGGSVLCVWQFPVYEARSLPQAIYRYVRSGANTRRHPAH